MTADASGEALTPEEQNERLAQIRRIIEEGLARDTSRGEEGGTPDRDQKKRAPRGEEGGTPGAASEEEHIRPAGPADCSRRICRRMGTCRPPRGGVCAGDPNERMRREIWERMVALRKQEERRARG